MAGGGRACIKLTIHEPPQLIVIEGVSSQKRALAFSQLSEADFGAINRA